MTAFYMCRALLPDLLRRLQGLDGRAARRSSRSRSSPARRRRPPRGGPLARPGYPPHESPWQMTVPLIILAAFSLFAGILNPGFGLLKEKPLDHWLEPVFKAATEGAVLFAHGNDAAVGRAPASGRSRSAASPRSSSERASPTGCTSSKKGEPAAQLAAAFPGLYQLLLDKWRVDELYDATVIAVVDSLADTSAAVRPRHRRRHHRAPHGAGRRARRAPCCARSRTASCTSTPR